MSGGGLALGQGGLDLRGSGSERVWGGLGLRGLGLGARIWVEGI